MVFACAGESAAPELAALTAAMATGYSQDLAELEAFAHGDYNGELHGALGGICSPRGSRLTSEDMAGLGLGAAGLDSPAPAAAAGTAAGPSQ
jgi:hypothetical protein